MHFQMNPQWNDCSLSTFQIKDEPAIDYDGVKAEVFSNFWLHASMEFLHGNENSMSPRSKGMTNEQLIAIGRIRRHGFILTGFFPLHLSEAFVEVWHLW